MKYLKKESFFKSLKDYPFQRYSIFVSTDKIKKNMHTHTSCYIYFCLLHLISTGLISCDSGDHTAASHQNLLQPYTENPYYWQMDGEPVLLIGASDYHNIFQRPDLVVHLDLLQSVGGNYVRNTMASREILPDHRDLWPFRIVEDTQDSLIFIYDLDQWNDEYWQHFEAMLEETSKRNMIVEVTIWERHDFYRTRDQAGWARQPFNPDNNINYESDESGLPVGEYPEPGEDIYNPASHPFFRSVPSMENNTLLLPYQQAFVDKILTYTFNYDHVIYNINNETQESNLWGEYWGKYIQQMADERGITIYMTDMQDAHDVTDESVARMMNSELFTFVDMSQNNFQKSDLHWERIQYIRDYIRNHPKPVTNIKVYGTDNDNLDPEFWGSAQDGKERFWRNIIGSASSARFHRPPWGIGLNEEAQSHVHSAVMFADSMDIFSAAPRMDLLANREPGSAWLLANPGMQYAVYFGDGGSVDLLVGDNFEGNIRGP
ncbi:hypothetical protein BH23BAC3_BH23BAC3_33780 [soil metagenome]